MVFYHILRGSLGAIVWLILAVGGYFLIKILIYPLNYIVGAPILLSGLGLTLNSLFRIILAVSSPIFIRGTCILCRK
ncbi:hypothetical protein A2V56_01910 [Candidatus Woesebacteria bacterium RBG_19FT_COMBO_42_9]|uniref:Uncharacterized protein n=1 Tax=Candidatus Woesebacteria bacterium RBG_16_42_24 TaxID=1802485 RepID=A0A1F7XKS2_9BACT|nr:MAG: hypothetical protein A2V97_02645 [Candidatus Woesebacteria bacterium RBG_16_42_24]OGM17069.1 MAG: hypothetical protein A2V56_01910 [Candidatus Woesebacteria bacterium RBG_19FT_COMBO_42_9]OGM66913.1 MAG: hypothetical protein A2985_01910 [Candidatus Woesebacteria bacterium RIFCSPLOWO2_01_FULL_43_11]